MLKQNRYIQELSATVLSTSSRVALGSLATLPSDSSAVGVVKSLAMNALAIAS
jgi:hypothetical protein